MAEDRRTRFDLEPRNTWIEASKAIDGLWVDADDGRTLNVGNPATGERVGVRPECLRRRP